MAITKDIIKFLNVLFQDYPEVANQLIRHEVKFSPPMEWRMKHDDVAMIHCSTYTEDGGLVLDVPRLLCQLGVHIDVNAKVDPRVGIGAFSDEEYNKRVDSIQKSSPTP